MVTVNANFHKSSRVPGPVVLSGRAIRVLDNPPSPATKDIRIHAWINERLAVLHHEKHSLWTKVRRFLFAGSSN